MDMHRAARYLDGGMESGFFPTFHPFRVPTPERTFTPVVVNWSSTQEIASNKLRENATNFSKQKADVTPLGFSLNWMTILGLQTTCQKFPIPLHSCVVSEFSQPKVTTLHLLIKKP